jgi:hypothetical protein
MSSAFAFSLTLRGNVADHVRLWRYRVKPFDIDLLGGLDRVIDLDSEIMN